MNEDRSAKIERVRIRFAREAKAAETGHVDLVRAWEHALAAAGVPVSYSSGRKRQVRIIIAAGLAQGMTSDGELVDIFLYERMTAHDVLARVAAHLPPGLRAIDAREVGIGLPSLPAATRWADFDVTIPATQDWPFVSSAIERFLSSESVPWEDTRGEKVRHYDLRALVQEIRAARCGEVIRLFMRLRCDSVGVGRPDQVVKVLGLADPEGIHRSRLILAESSPARNAWRRRGRLLE